MMRTAHGQPGLSDFGDRHQCGGRGGIAILRVVAEKADPAEAPRMAEHEFRQGASTIFCAGVAEYAEIEGFAVERWRYESPMARQTG